MTLAAATTRVRADAEPRPFRYDLRIEAPLLAVGAAAWLATEALKPRLAPARCRLCEPGSIDHWTQETLRWGWVPPARRASDVLLFGVVPAAAFGTALGLGLAHGSGRDALVDTMVLGEAFVLTGSLTQLAKYLSARERPYARTQRIEGRDFYLGPDDMLSFFSGHTSLTFTLAVAAGSTASLRGYREAPIVWAVGLPLALATGYFRIAADRHYLTDVLTGALVGSAVGFFVPWLHAHGMRRAPEPRSASSARGATMPLSFVW